MNEHQLQLAVAAFLKVAMPAGWPWTAVDHAAVLTPRQGAQRKARGVKRGQADFRFVLRPDGRSAEIELKVKGGYQSPEQREWDGAITEAGGLYLLCRSVAEVEGALRGWGVPLRASCEARAA